EMLYPRAIYPLNSSPSETHLVVRLKRLPLRLETKGLTLKVAAREVVGNEPGSLKDVTFSILPEPPREIGVDGIPSRLRILVINVRRF
ncbi:MAG: hypothetical protein ACE5H0_09260, partial [Bacteroidota bacterium]